MALPELANGFLIAEREEIEHGVRAVHGVPLIDLLEGENKNCAIAQDSVSIYSIGRPNGVEYAVVFPPLSGRELNKRLAGISKVKAGIIPVSIDFSMINRSMQGTRAKAHESGLGVLWEVFSESLPIQTKVFNNGAYNEKTEEQKQYDEELAWRKIQSFEALSQLTLKPYRPIMDRERQIIDMLEGKSSIQTEELIDFFNLTASEIAVGRLRDLQRKTSVKKVRRQMQGKWARIPQDQWANLVLGAAKEKVVKNEDDPDENNRYFAGALHGFARRKIQLPGNTVGVSRGLEYFTIPKVNGIKTADLFEDDAYILHFQQHDEAKKENFKFSVKIFVDESGSTIFAGESPDDARRELAKIKKRAIPISLAVPVVRFLETRGGERGFIFNETGPDLPQVVVDEVRERVNASERSSKPFAKDWLSGMVGVDMLVIAHPDIRTKKNDQDDRWGKIWGKDRITMSEVMDEEVKQGEPTQINGPVQAGIIALHALARYPETFDPFMDNVISVVKKNENSGNI